MIICLFVVKLEKLLFYLDMLNYFNNMLKKDEIVNEVNRNVVRRLDYPNRKPKKHAVRVFSFLTPIGKEKKNCTLSCHHCLFVFFFLFQNKLNIRVL